MKTVWVVLTLGILSGCANRSASQATYADDWARAPIPTNPESIGQECRALADAMAREGNSGAAMAGMQGGMPALQMMAVGESRRRQSVLQQRQSDLGCGLPSYGRAPQMQQQDTYGDLLKLKDLHDKGLVTDQEFETRRSRLVNGK